MTYITTFCIGYLTTFYTWHILRHLFFMACLKLFFMAYFLEFFMECFTTLFRPHWMAFFMAYFTTIFMTYFTKFLKVDFMTFFAICFTTSSIVNDILHGQLCRIVCGILSPTNGIINGSNDHLTSEIIPFRLLLFGVGLSGMRSLQGHKRRPDSRYNIHIGVMGPASIHQTAQSSPIEPISGCLCCVYRSIDRSVMSASFRDPGNDYRTSSPLALVYVIDRLMYDLLRSPVFVLRRMSVRYRLMINVGRDLVN